MGVTAALVLAIMFFGWIKLSTTGFLLLLVGLFILITVFEVFAAKWSSRQQRNPPAQH